MQKDVTLPAGPLPAQRHPGRALDLAALLVSALLGAIVALLIFPHDLLLGGGAYWDHVVGDNAAGVIGFYSFAYDEWRWPLLYTKLINYPLGANIYYTDAVPVMAVLWKVVYKLTGHLYPYFGLWMLFSYMMNSMFGYLIFRHLRMDFASALISAVLFVLLPEFIWRHVHIGLVGQFAIVAALYAYLRFTSVSSFREIVLVSIVFCFAVMINTYIFSMSAALIVAGLLDAWRLKRIGAGGVALVLVAMGAVVIALAFVLGLIGTGEALPASGGFGQYSMNLLSPIWPQFSILSKTRFLDPIGGQYEGFNYLGLGVLSLFGLSLVFGWRTYLRAVTARPFIVLILFALFFYALSRYVYAGSSRIAAFSYDEWPVIGRVTEILRSSGRFFWPVGYAIVVVSVVALYRRLGSRWFAAMAALAVLAQTADLQPLFQVARANANKYQTLVAPDPDITVDLLRSRDVVLVYPGALCGQSKDQDRALQVQLLAARAGRPFDGAYINRGNRSCSDVSADFVKDPFRGIDASRALLVLMKGSISSVTAAYGLGPDVECREARYAFFCGRAPLDERLNAVGATVSTPALPLNATLHPNSNGSPFLIGGWTAPGGAGQTFRWAEGSQTRFVGKLPHEVCGSITFSTEILPFAFKDYAVRSAIVSILGGGSQTITLDQIRQQRLDLVLPLDRCVDRLDIAFTFSDLKSPLDVGMNKDPRKVTWGFFDFRVGAGAAP